MIGLDGIVVDEDHSNFTPEDHDRLHVGDNNGDGVVDVHDVPFEPGSIDSKLAWRAIDAEAHGPEAIAKAKAAGYDKAVGWYHGKPLGDGVTGKEYSTWQYIVNKVHYFDGLDWDVAKKIANRATSSMEWSGE